MTCNLQVIFVNLNDHHHFIRPHRDLSMPTFGATRVPRGAKPGWQPLFSEMRQTPADQIVGARPFLRQQVMGPDTLPGLAVDHRKLHRMSSFAVHEFERRPGV
jgi:hypothetical protein